MGNKPREIKSKPFIFVLMPFDESFNHIYHVGIKQACKASGAYCGRVDEQFFEETILERIYDQITKADIIVSDMTGRNPNVFYETGYAHAIGKRVILLTQKAEDIPFDLKHYPHIIYNGQIKKLKSDLENKLSWMIKSPKSFLFKKRTNVESNSKLQQKSVQIDVVTNPVILFGCTSPYPKASNADPPTIRTAFPQSKLFVEKNLTSDRFRTLLLIEKFDIIHLVVGVNDDGSIFFSNNRDRISNEGVVQLLEICNTKLLILACCNSLPLAAKLLTTTNMITATGSMEEERFRAWQKVFYKLLSDHNPLSQAFSAASSIVQLPIVILIKKDIVFIKSK